MASNENLELSELSNINDEQIDIRKLLNTVLRNKKLIGYFSLIGILVGLILAIFHKDLWKGKFQIVIEDKSSSPLGLIDQLSDNSALSSFIDLGGSDELETQVAILKSPSVLMDIFNFVKESKDIDGYRFKKWSRNLKIGLEKGTSVLNLEYQDNDKELILPVLEQISSKYKKYTASKKNKELSTGLNYLSNQITIFKKRSEESFKKAKEYGEKYDLSLNSFSSEEQLNAGAQVPKVKNSLQSNVELARANAINNLRSSKELLKTIKNLEDESELLPSYAKKYLPPDQNSILVEYLENNKLLASAEQIYLKNDQLLNYRKKKKEDLKLLLKNELLSFLQAEINSYNAIVKSTSRPDGVFIEFKNLNQAAMKDDATLNYLENQYRFFSLEKAKKGETWDLITEPTLIPYPVGATKKGKLFLSVIISTLIGLLAAFAKDRKQDLLYELEELEDFLNYKNICVLELYDKEISNENLKIFNHVVLNKLNKPAIFYYVGEITKENLEITSNYIKKYLKSNDFSISNKISEVFDYENLILILQLGQTTKNNIIDTINKFKNYKKQINAILVLKS